MIDHWAHKYFDIRHRMGGVGPDEFDCLNFFKLVQLERFHKLVDLTDLDKERAQWTRIERPVEGCAVLMSLARVYGHMGIWISANSTQGVLHCAEKVNVVFTPPQVLARLGYSNLQYYTK